MEVIAKVVTEFFMMVLCVTAAPVDQQEVRIDMIDAGSYVDTMIVRREKVGFTVYDEMNGKLVEFARIVPKDGAENVYVVTRMGKSEVVDLSNGIAAFDVEKLRTKNRLQLKTTDEDAITVQRSADVTYLTSKRMRRTYVVH